MNIAGQFTKATRPGWLCAAKRSESLSRRPAQIGVILGNRCFYTMNKGAKELTDDKIKEAYNGIDTLQAEIEIGDFIECKVKDLRKKSIARLEAAKEVITEQAAEVERLEKQVDALSERVAIMQEGRDAWHFSGTPEIPAGRNQVTVIVWTESGKVRTMDYCRALESKKVYWCCSTQTGRVKAWRYMPKPPEGVEG